MKEYSIEELYAENMGFGVETRRESIGEESAYFPGVVSDARDMANEMTFESLVLELEKQDMLQRRTMYRKIHNYLGKDIDKSIEQWSAKNYDNVSKTYEHVCNEYGTESALSQTLNYASIIFNLPIIILPYIIQRFFDNKLSKDVSRIVVLKLMKNKEFLKIVEDIRKEVVSAIENFNSIGQMVEKNGQAAVKEILDITGLTGDMKAGKIQWKDDNAIGQAVDEINMFNVFMKRVKFYSNFGTKGFKLKYDDGKKKLPPVIMKAFADIIGNGTAKDIPLREDYLRLVFNTNEVFRTDLTRRIQKSMSDTGTSKKIMDVANKLFIPSSCKNVSFKVVEARENMPFTTVTGTTGNSKITCNFYLHVQLSKDYSAITRIMKETVEESKKQKN